MNRKEITKLLTDILISDKLSDRKYYAKEVTLDYGAENQKRVDVMQFSPKGVLHTSDIEKGTFTCYEIKSCVDDVYSGHGLNFFGEKNYIVTNMETYKKLQQWAIIRRRIPNLKNYIEEIYPESSNNFGLLVAVPKRIDLRDTDALHKEFTEPTEFKGSPNDWRLWTAIPCNIGHRDRSTTELLFCMLRSKHSYTNKEEYHE